MLQPERATQHQGENRTPRDLLYALNNVALALQQSIRNEADIYNAFRRQVVALKLRGGISLLDEQGDKLFFKAIANTSPLRRILSRFENQLGLKAEGFSVAVEQVDVYRKVIREKETVFVEDTSAIAALIIPMQMRNIVSPLLSVLGSPPGIYSPLIFGGEVKGMFNIVGRNLSEGDIPAVRAFSNQIAVALENARLVERLVSAKEELDAAYEATLVGWVEALDLRDQITEGHTLRVADMTVRLAERMKVPEAQIRHLRRGALLHDIGKMAIPDSILGKPGPLTEAESRIMREHPTHAYRWLSEIAYLQPAAEIPYCHHERLDGSGYPRGLKGEDIPLTARIFAVIDVWDAMTTDRPYRRCMKEDEVTAYLSYQAGVLFDGQVVKKFLEMVKTR